LDRLALSSRIFCWEHLFYVHTLLWARS